MKKTIVFIMILGICSCASVGSKEIADPGKVSQIEEGRTTKAEVRVILGEPARVFFADNGEESWEYIHIRSTTRAASFIPVVGLFAGGADVKSQTLSIRFTAKGVVKKIGGGQMVGGGGSLRD